MTKTRNLLSFTVLLICVVAEVQADINFQGTGNVDGSSIEMRIQVNDSGEIEGSYAYTKIGKPIYLRGRIDSERLHLTSQNVTVKEHFDGKVLRQDGALIRISGRWRQEGKNRSYPFAVANQPDPYDDNHISCDEMSNSPAMVFRDDVDLGTGFGSPNDVDYDCPKSLANVEFLKPLTSLAYGIRESSGLCSGTKRYVESRHFALDLAELGYFPQNNRYDVRDSRGEKYFEEWGFQSLHNRAIYLDYLKLLDSVRPKLSEWYTDNTSVDYDTGSAYAEKALNTISNFAFGRISSQWSPESLVPHTDEALQGDSNAFLDAFGSADSAQKLNTLRRLLASNSDIALVRALLATMPDVTEVGRSESPLSLAVYDPPVLSLMLQTGFEPNHQNEFGKTPLYYAIDFNQPESVQLLLENGADVNHGYQEADPSDVRWRWGCTAIKHWNRTPLMHAAQHADIAILKLLLAAGADINLQDSMGKTALDYAKNNNRPQNLEFLLTSK